LNSAPKRSTLSRTSCRWYSVSLTAAPSLRSLRRRYALRRQAASAAEPRGV
jgi:hypothetical protein